MAAVAPAQKNRPGRLSGAPPEQAPQGQQQRTEEDPEQDRHALVGLLVLLGHPLHRHAWSAGWKIRPAVGGVVVGDQDDRALGLGISASAITLKVGLCGRTLRRNQRRPPPTSS